MRTTLTQAGEDYLKAIYELSIGGNPVSTTQLAKHLKVAPASVTGMLQKLALNRPPLLVYKKHHGVTMTPEGRSVALEIIRHHRLIELFLYKSLGYSWDEVHEEADRLEHVMSDFLEDHIAEALDNPTHDPHGDPIPDRDLNLPPFSTTPLSELRPGQKAVVQRVNNIDPELLRYLDGIGILPEAKLEIQDFSPFDKNLRIRVIQKDSAVVLGPAVTTQVFVEKIE
ncbi:MAG: metal-dependent transcriptional regulator [Anaerolineaceae bacterium]|nr:metal-dependent transcriptional regulator [Anaerolineaceae bacterium]